MDEHGRTKVEDFCIRDAGGAHAVQVMFKSGQTVRDIGEFRFEEWGDGLTDGVLGWIDGQSVTDVESPIFELRALRLTGERCGGDDVWETIVQTEVT